MKHFLLALFFFVGACGGTSGNNGENVKKDGSEQQPSPNPGDPSGNDLVIGKCDDPLNPLKIGDKCYRSCDETYRYCLKDGEMASQTDPERKIPLCSFESGRLLIDDKCGRGVVTVDSSNMIFKIGNDSTDREFYKYHDGSVFENPDIKKYYGGIYFDAAYVYDYFSKFPMIIEYDVISIGEKSVEAGRMYPGAKDHAKLTWILNINGHVLETLGMNTNVAEEYCQTVLNELTQDDPNSDPDIRRTKIKDDTFQIYCSSTLHRSGHVEMSFFCHNDTKNCFFRKMNLWGA